VGRVTGLDPDPRRPAAVRVHEDGAHAFTVAREAAARLGLVVGRELDLGLRHALQEAADTEAALRAALRLLGARAHAVAELGRRLGRKGHQPAAVQAVLERLAADGLLDDAAFARSFVERGAGRGRGPARLRRDLLARGVARADIDAALGAWLARSGEEPAPPRELLERRARALAGLPAPMRRRRLLAFLARRGYRGAAARRAVAQVA